MSQSEPRKLSLKEIAERSAKTLASKSVAAPPSGSSTDMAETLAAFAARASGAVPPMAPSPSVTPAERQAASSASVDFDDAPPRAVRPAANPFAASALPAEALTPRAPAALSLGAFDGPASLPPMSRRTLPPQVMTQPPPPDSSTSRSSWKPLAGGALAVALAAASFAVMSKRGSSLDTNAPVLDSNASPPPGAAVRSIDAQDAAPEQVVAAKVDEKAAEVAPPVQAQEQAPSTMRAAAAKAPDAKRSDEKKAISAEAPAAAAPAPVEAVLAVAAAPAPRAATGVPGDLGDEIRKSVGASDKVDDAKAAKAPEVGNGAAQDKPSTGAVQGALNGVRSAAKACLDGQEVVTRVGVVFGSNGSVSAVSITGGAAGSPAEGCVRAAVMKAKVEPFTSPTFSTSLTLRP